MKRLIAWAGRNIDGLVTLVIAAMIVALDVFSTIPEDWKSSGVLLVLGALTVAMLRDREELRRIRDIPPTLATLGSTVAAVERAIGDVSMVRVLTWSEVSATYAEARRTTDRWVFRGGTGTYMRAKTLPGCIAHSRRARRGLTVRMEIIDPTDEEVCASYGRFRRSLDTSEADWTMERTQRESYATIVACCWYRQRFELLDVRIGLSRVMPTLRWDLSASSLVITQGDPRKPALMVERGKPLYDYLYTELAKSLEQARPVPLEQARHVELSEQPTFDQVHRLFAELGMPLPSSFTDRDVADIIDRALRPENPYDP